MTARAEIDRENHRRECVAFSAVIALLRGSTFAEAAKLAGVTPERIRQRLFRFRRQMMTHPARDDLSLLQVSGDWSISEFREHADVWVPAIIKFARERGHQLPEDKS